MRIVLTPLKGLKTIPKGMTRENDNVPINEVASGHSPIDFPPYACGGFHIRYQS